MEHEVWLPVEGTFGFYEVSSAGRVRSLDRFSPNRWRPILRRGKLLSQCLNAYGYPLVCMNYGGKGRTRTVHRLVAETFIPREGDLQVNHIDGDKTNNCLSNLEWISHNENMKHAVKTGLLRTEKRRRASSSRATVPWEVVVQIRELVASGLSQGKTAKRFGVSQPYVSSVVHNKVRVK